MVLLGIAILLAVLGASLTERGRSLLGDHRKLIFLTVACAVFSFLLIVSILQYKSMAVDPFSKFFLPPYQSIRYFMFAVAWARVFAPYVISFLLSLIFLAVALGYNKEFDEKFFEKEEAYVGALSIFLSGHPQWIFYFIFLVFGYVLVQLYIRFVMRKLEERVPLYYLWVPVAIFVILISKYWLSSFEFWSLLKV